MASLALIISLIFLSLIIIGPLSYIICSFDWTPKLLKYFLAIFCMIVGLWAIFIPVPLFKILGLINFSIGLKLTLKAK
jgi:hypothetical protein